MTKLRSRILIMALIVMAFTVSTVYAQNSSWTVEQIVSGHDDGFITETGVKWFDTTWIELKNRAVSLSSYYAFRGVEIPQDAIILNAYLQFTAPHPFTFPAAESLDVTIYGIKTGDLVSWSPTPDLESEPFTNALTNFDTTNMSNRIKINVTVTNQVKEIYSLSSWTDGNDMGFRILSVFVDDHLATRYQESFDNSPLASMKLYIEYVESTELTTYYKGYRIEQSIVNQFGLDSPRYWVDKPISMDTFGGGAPVRENVTTWDMPDLYNGTYGEPFDYVEPYQEGIFYDQVSNTDLTLNFLRSPTDVGWGVFNSSDKTFGQAVTFYMIGNYTESAPYDGHIVVLNAFGESFSGTWTGRSSANSKAMGLQVTEFNASHVTLIPSRSSTFLDISALDSTLGPIAPNNYYLIKTSIRNFANFWHGSKYEYAYANNVFSFDANTGEVISLGRANAYFNVTGDISDMNSFSLYEVNGDGVSSGAGLTHQMLRGWNPEISYPGYTVYDENDTLIGTFDTLDDAEAGVDNIPGVGQTPDEPNPPGTNWPEEGFGETTRFNMRFVIWGVGWFLIIGPIIIMCVKPWPLNIYLIFFLCVVLGFGLQLSIGSI